DSHGRTSPEKATCFLVYELVWMVNNPIKSVAEHPAGLLKQIMRFTDVGVIFLFEERLSYSEFHIHHAVMKT
ncbi:MAG TPA: hypothetical protein VHP14_01065, partial [Anaerolineales bacterium]|nr:hypothetical protein [Anaerolineales bacterium]